jgi:hypothetical protein
VDELIRVGVSTTPVIIIEGGIMAGYYREGV